VLLIRISALKQREYSNIAHKLVIDHPLNKPSRIIFMTGIIKCSFNCCQSDVNVFLGFEGLDGMKKLLGKIIAKKPEGMLCQKSKN
jgi:hypothetical protein